MLTVTVKRAVRYQPEIQDLEAWLTYMDEHGPFLIVEEVRPHATTEAR